MAFPYIPQGQGIERGPEWDNLRANRQGFESILGGLMAIQQGKREQANRAFLATLLQSQGQPGQEGRSAPMASLMQPNRGPESFIGKIGDSLNPFSPSRGMAPMQESIVGRMLERQLFSEPERDPYEGFSSEERDRARRVGAGLAPRATAPKPVDPVRAEKAQVELEILRKRLLAMNDKSSKYFKQAERYTRMAENLLLADEAKSQEYANRAHDFITKAEGDGPPAVSAGDESDNIPKSEDEFRNTILKLGVGTPASTAYYSRYKDLFGLD